LEHMELESELEEEEEDLCPFELDDGALWYDHEGRPQYGPFRFTDDSVERVGALRGGLIVTTDHINTLPDGEREWEMHEDDLREEFVRAQGPGGQKVNKTSSAVVLVHLPTGTRVKCQEFRDQHANRKRARRVLKERLDELLMGKQSRGELKRIKIRKKKANKKRKFKRKMEAKAAEVEKETAPRGAGMIPGGDAARDSAHSEERARMRRSDVE